MVLTRSQRKRRRTPGNEDYYLNKKDFISRLPDGILLSILEKLPVRDSTRTSALARRWKYLWKSMSVIVVNDCMEEDGGTNATKFLTSFIRKNPIDKLKRFSVHLRYKGDRLNSCTKWISFAVSKNVEQLSLELYIRELYWQEKSYPIVQLPKIFFNSSSLVRVKLTFMNLDPLPNFHLPSLRDLQLDRSQLPDDGVEKITANCPVLEYLLLSNCNRDKDLKITVAAHSNLSTIVVDDKDRLAVGQSPETSIFAPKVTTLLIMCRTNMRKYSLDNVPDVVEATVDFLESYPVYFVLGFEKHVREKIASLLEKLSHAKMLRLCTRCILSAFEMRIRDLKFELTRLELNTRLGYGELTGILFLLRACPRLEQLVVNIRLPPILYIDGNLELDVVAIMDNLDHQLCPLERLTCVEFKNLKGYYQRWEEGKFKVRRFFSRCENGIKLLDFLKSSPFLNVQQFCFTTSEQQFETTAVSEFL